MVAVAEPWRSVASSRRDGQEASDCGSAGGSVLGIAPGSKDGRCPDNGFPDKAGDLRGIRSEATIPSGGVGLSGEYARVVQRKPWVEAALTKEWERDASEKPDPTDDVRDRTLEE